IGRVDGAVAGGDPLDPNPAPDLDDEPRPLVVAPLHRPHGADGDTPGRGVYIDAQAVGGSLGGAVLGSTDLDAILVPARYFDRAVKRLDRDPAARGTRG